jgi:hypothetical protein
MARLEDTIVARIQSLVEESHSLSIGDRHGSVDENQRQRCAAWLVSAGNVVHRLCESPDSAYRKHADALLAADHGYVVNNAVGEMGALLSNLLSARRQA